MPLLSSKCPQNARKTGKFVGLEGVFHRSSADRPPSHPLDAQAGKGFRFGGTMGRRPREGRPSNREAVLFRFLTWGSGRQVAALSASEQDEGGNSSERAEDERGPAQQSVLGEGAHASVEAREPDGLGGGDVALGGSALEGDVAGRHLFHHDLHGVTLADDGKARHQEKQSHSGGGQCPEKHRIQEASRIVPHLVHSSLPKRAAEPSSSSMRSSWLYLQIRSVRQTDPVLICPVQLPTTRSAMVVSSVSPLR